VAGRPNLSDISGTECAAAVVAGFSVLKVLYQGSSDQITENTLHYRSQERNQGKGPTDSSFWSFASWLQERFSSFVALRKLCFDC